MSSFDHRYLFLIRGLPGSGKSTLAAALGAPVFSADDYFVGDDGVYRFEPADIAEAHAQCQARTRSRLCVQSVSVANTFTCRWELQPYLDMAAEAGATPVVIDLFDAGLSDEALVERNVHNVPSQAVGAMRYRYEHDWRRGDPRAPWERN